VPRSVNKNVVDCPSSYARPVPGVPRRPPGGRPPECPSGLRRPCLRCCAGANPNTMGRAPLRCRPLSRRLHSTCARGSGLRQIGPQPSSPWKIPTSSRCRRLPTIATSRDGRAQGVDRHGRFTALDDRWCRLPRSSPSAPETLLRRPSPSRAAAASPSSATPRSRNGTKRRRRRLTRVINEYHVPSFCISERNSRV